MTVNRSAGEIGVHYAHPRPADLIHNHPNDLAEFKKDGGIVAVCAAPRRGDSVGSAANPVFEGYNGSTNTWYNNQTFR